MTNAEPEAEPVVVLVVEDDMIVRLIASDILRDAGYDVVEARDGVEALGILQVRRDVSVLFTDAAMPNMDGLSLTKIVRESWPDVSVVLTSGALPVGARQKMPIGVRFVPKPYTANMLLEAFATCVGNEGA